MYSLKYTNSLEECSVIALIALWIFKIKNYAWVTSALPAHLDVPKPALHDRHRAIHSVRFDACVAS
jgi:hypothetical protein